MRVPCTNTYHYAEGFQEGERGGAEGVEGSGLEGEGVHVKSWGGPASLESSAAVAGEGS